MERKRVVVAMSGGVDSCVAAAILRDEGYDVIGMTMQLWDHGKGGSGPASTGRFNSCCSLTDVHDARQVAHHLGIPHYVVNYEKEFRQGVVDYFAREYAQGRTPNPCVMCNSQLKFDHLVERAKALGATQVATGHYAQINRIGEGADDADEGAFHLRRGVDRRKDQSYFLFDLKPQYLQAALFPLGGMTKAEVRQLASKYGIHTADKHESQEICFVSGNSYADFLEEHYPDLTDKPGDIVDRRGRVLGRHQGIHKFTVGQRKGLGNLQWPDGESKPMYVAQIDPQTARVVVDEQTSLAVDAFDISHANWLGGHVPSADQTIDVVVRYRATPISCRVVSRGDHGEFRVILAESSRWVSPGQAAVFYDGDRVLGGGFIDAPRAESRRDVPGTGADLSAPLGTAQ